MRSVPYGYRIENAKAVPEPVEAERVKAAFIAFLKEGTLAAAKRESGISREHSAIGMMLADARYKGDEFFPAIISEETFNAVQEKRLTSKRKRAPMARKMALPGTRFQLPAIDRDELSGEPSEKAEYIYEQIEVKE